MITLEKKDESTSYWLPLEQGTLVVENEADARMVVVCDGRSRQYVQKRLPASGRVRFRARGSAGTHTALVLDAEGEVLDEQEFVLKPRTSLQCDKGPYATLANQLADMMSQFSEHSQNFLIEGKRYRMLVCWSRDHVYTLKAQKYYIDDVKSGMDFFLERPRPDGTFWDCIHRNDSAPYPSWFCEALGEGFFGYADDRKWIFRRIPVLADVEFVITEGVYYAWKASGDDDWLAAQMPKLEAALKYNSSNPHCWSRKEGLVRRSFCMDGWDFANPLFCKGDHRVLHKGDPQFFFHGDNSGLYSIYWRMAEMYEHIGNEKRAAELRQEGEAFRKRANRKMFFKDHYGHMIPEKLPEKDVYAKVGDERERMSLATGYTLNRGMPTHDMVVKVLKEYQRRGKAKRGESFAEWWSMDPPYMPEQWPGHGSPWGEYMNGAVCPIVAGELAKAAFDHGMEDYGSDILRRVWELCERDGGHLHQVYRRLPATPPPPKANFRHVDLKAFANVGLRNGADEGVVAWTDEGDNDMRNLPVGKRRFGAIEFDVVNPKTNDGKSIVALRDRWITIPVDGLLGRSLYFMHTLPHGIPAGTVAGYYDVCYADGTEERIHVRNGHEVGHWWGISTPNRGSTRIAWRGANGEWKTVGLFMHGWNNPHPDKPITAIRCKANSITRPPEHHETRHIQRPPVCGIMLAAVSISDEPVKFEEPIRSYGLPDSWSQAAVYYAVSEGLAGIEDKGSAFSEAKVSPRWASTESRSAEITMHYPASDGYCAYRYRHDPAKRRMQLDLTGSFEAAEVHCLMPRGRKAKRVRVGREEVRFRNTTIEESSYVDFRLDGLPEDSVAIEY
jgi:hypothetical protein